MIDKDKIAELRRLEADIDLDHPGGVVMSHSEYRLHVAMRNAMPELLKALEEARERSAIMENALTNISMMHDSKPPISLADIPEIDYARRVITTMRLEARHALQLHGGVDVG